MATANATPTGAYKIVAPVVNINGTSPDSLLDGVLDVLRSLRAARSAILEATPHGRDFQTATPALYAAARDQHRARLVKLAELIDEYDILANAIAEQRR